jgi:hypothetical protein
VSQPNGFTQTGELLIVGNLDSRKWRSVPSRYACLSRAAALKPEQMTEWRLLVLFNQLLLGLSSFPQEIRVRSIVGVEPQ